MVERLELLRDISFALETLTVGLLKENGPCRLKGTGTMRRCDLLEWAWSFVGGSNSQLPLQHHVCLQANILLAMRITNEKLQDL